MSPFIRPVVFPKPGICYVENMKCGSSSIIECIGRQAGWPITGQSRAQERLQILRSTSVVDARTLPLFIKRTLVRPENNSLVFSFVRNPYIRILSGYLDLIERGRQFPMQRIEIFGERAEPSFYTFARYLSETPTSRMNVHWRPQYELLDPDNVVYDFIGRLETFHDDMSALFPELSLGGARMGQENRTEAKRLVNLYYTDEIAELVRNRYREDFDLFEYSDRLEEASAAEEKNRQSCKVVTRRSVGSRGLGWHLARATAGAFNWVQRSWVWRAAWWMRRLTARLRGWRKGSE